MKALYEELQEFKFNPEFRQHGFGVCCRFNGWKLKVENLESLAGLEFGAEFGFRPGDLIMLGMEYVQGNYEGDFVMDLENTIETKLGAKPNRSQQDPDAKCRDASHKANYSQNPAEFTRSMEYFRQNCTWEGEQPVAR